MKRARALAPHRQPRAQVTFRGPDQALVGAATETTTFDPRHLRIAALIAVFFIVAPGSLFGASMLWVLGGGTTVVPLVPSSTHALLQLAGGFMTLIWGFLAFGVPHLLGLDALRARRVLGGMILVATALVVDVVALLAGQMLLDTIARFVGVAGALAGTIAFARARARHAPLQTHPTLRAMPVPFLAGALALYPLAWLGYALEPFGSVPTGAAGDAMLFLCVVPVVLSMGWKMFSAMLQLDAGNPARLAVALSSWLIGGGFVVLARWLPSLAAYAAPFLLVGALGWLVSLHGLRRRRGGLALMATAGPELRVHVVIGAAALVLSPILWMTGALTERFAFYDLARHTLALGFVLVITTGVTLRALPRFCRGRPSSPRFALVGLGVLMTGLLLRGGRVLDDAFGPELVRASAALTLAAVVLWGAHLVRGLREAPAARSE